jgi:hypothetical protein
MMCRLVSIEEAGRPDDDAERTEASGKKRV